MKQEPHRSGYDGRVDGGETPALDLLVARGWCQHITLDGDGTPLDCTACPFSSRSIEPYEQIDNDVTEAHYACSMLGRVVWGEYAPCTREDWIRAERGEHEMTKDGYVRKHMPGHAPPIDKLADAFAGIATPVQLAKMVEEVGEAAGAYVGMLGANPRKGETHTMEDFHKELLDVALTALMLYRNTGGGPAIGALHAHIEARWKRHVDEVLGGVEPSALSTNVSVSEMRVYNTGNRGWNIDPTDAPRDWRGARILPTMLVMVRETPEGPRGTVVDNAPDGVVTAQHEVLVRWHGGSSEDVWEVASSLEIA